jgi:hypothetical protein
MIFLDSACFLFDVDLHSFWIQTVVFSRRIYEFYS